VLNDLTSGRDIIRLTEDLLKRADAAGRWPTPVNDIVEAAELEESDESPFDAWVLARAPKHLRKAIALVNSSRVRAVLDRRERTVHLDPAIEHAGRRSFLRLHETSHDLFPWQQELAYADDDATLSPATNRLFEQEANQGAAEILFQGSRFGQMANEYRIGVAAVSELSGNVGASLQATLRRYAETHRAAVCGLVLDASPIDRQPLSYRRREASQSPAWTERFGRSWFPVLSEDCYPFISAIARANSPAPLETVVAWPDLNCEPVDVRAEAISNRFGHLLLLWVPRRETFKRRRTLAVGGRTA